MGKKRKMGGKRSKPYDAIDHQINSFSAKLLGIITKSIMSVISSTK